MGYFEIILVLILATVPALLFRKRGVETHGPFCMWRTKKGLALLDGLAKPEKFWRLFADAGAIFSFGILGAVYLYKKSGKTAKEKLKIISIYAVYSACSIGIVMPAAFSKGLAGFGDLSAVLLLGGIGFFVLYALLLNTFSIIMDYFIGIVPTPGIAPIIPGVIIEGSPISFPLHALIGLVVLLIVHEFAHGIVSRVEKIKVKSLGILTSGIFPIGAFAEPDEKKLNAAPVLKKTRIYAAGSMSNFMWGFIFFTVFFGMSAIMQPKMVQDPASPYPAYIPFEKPYMDHLLVVYVENGSAAQLAGMANGTKIYDVQLALGGKKPYAFETMNTSNGTVTLQRNGSGYFGFQYSPVKNTSAYDTRIWVKKYSLEIVFWTFALNFIVGVVNFLPFIAFDGAHLFADFVTTVSGWKKKNVQKISNAVSIFILLLLLLNALPYFIGKF